MAKITDEIKIGAFTLKNRITFAPTVKFDYTDDSGLVTEKHVEHYEKRAAGGCGLICVEATAVVPGGRFGKNHMGLWDDSQIDGHKRIVEVCKKHGAVVVIQLNHAGYNCNPECGPQCGPSEITMNGFMGPYTTKGLSHEEVQSMRDSFIAAAVRAQKAGYDGVQLHGCHSYMINQFVADWANKRTDEYGGSIENRARFGCEIIEGIRRECGPDFLISVRTTGCDPTVEAAIGVAECYVKAGCDYLQVSTGMSSLEGIPAFRDSKLDGVESLGARFKDHFKDRVPVSCVGGINTPEIARYIIENDYTDTIDVARAILADPNFANAVINDTPFSKCYGCRACQYGPFSKHNCPAGGGI